MLTVIVDTREKDPWTLRSSAIGERVVRKLDTGDYTIEGLEDVLCIERKKGPAELAGNFIEKRFKDVLKRIEQFPYKYLIVECDVKDVVDYPVGSNIPKSRWKNIKIRGPLIMKFLSEIQVNYGVHVIFAGSAENAEYVAVNIMKRVHEREQDRYTDNEEE
tara:strand:- start:3789 stop:4271 length:483 start_codon:yes stop_codon:yes gene_type:complete